MLDYILQAMFTFNSFNYLFFGEYFQAEGFKIHFTRTPQTPSFS